MRILCFDLMINIFIVSKCDLSSNRSNYVAVKTLPFFYKSPIQRRLWTSKLMAVGFRNTENSPKKEYNWAKPRSLKIMRQDLLIVGARF